MNDAYDILIKDLKSKEFDSAFLYFMTDGSASAPTGALGKFKSNIALTSGL